jgi:hypothetical protein
VVALLATRGFPELPGLIAHILFVLLLLISCLGYLVHLFFLRPSICFLRSTLFSQKKVTARVTFFYMVWKMLGGGRKKVKMSGDVVL